MFARELYHVVELALPEEMAHCQRQRYRIFSVNIEIVAEAAI